MSQNTVSNSTKTTIAISSEINSKITHHHNTDQSLITISEDKIKIILQENLKKIGEKKSWLTPLSIFISLTAIPITTDKFKSAFSLPAQFWQMAVYFGMCFSVFYLIRALFKAVKNRNISISTIIETMKTTDGN